MHSIELALDHRSHLLCSYGLLEPILVFTGDLRLFLNDLASPRKNDLLEVAGEHLVAIVLELVVAVLIIVLLSDLLLRIIRESASVLLFL